MSTLDIHASNNRQNPTPAEALLWQRLRAAQLGVHFRRQYPLLNRYLADFYAPAVKLVVEVDGGYHSLPATQRADGRRDKRLARVGVRVLRLRNELILSDLETAIALVRAALR